jgi:signal peptidase I
MNYFRKTYAFLKKDTWQSWIVSLILIFVGIKWIFFPILTLATGSPLPLVVVESCSMYHESNFDEWWSRNSVWYESKNITKTDFESFSFKSGLSKGDIILVLGKPQYNLGNIIIYNSVTQYPIIHRIISLNPIETKGDHNSDQLPYNIEKNIQKPSILGKASTRIPYLGWIKLIFYEPLKSPEERGFCK